MVAITHRLIRELRKNDRNARTHSTKQIHQIGQSIKEFGFLNPVLIDEKDMIVAGHGRAEAAKILGMAEVPTIRIEHLTEAQKRAYVIADNKLALKAGWDPEILAIELEYLTSAELDFDVEITGFETPEIDLLIDNGSPNRASKTDLIPPLAQTAVSSVGDLWQLGEHKIICGDARNAETYAALMGDERARLMFADPPYNVQIDGHVCGLGRIKHREFAMASGEMSADEYTDFLTEIWTHAAAFSTDGSIHFICCDWRHLGEALTSGQHVYSELKNLCVWNKNNAGMGSFYRSKHELVLVFKVGTEPHINTVELGKHGRYRSNVWDYPGVNTPRPGRTSDLEMHPTVKPTAMVMDAIKDCSKRGEIVIDPCGGSGTTLIAAEKTKRRARVIEIDPLYVDVTINRWQQLTGRVARHVYTGAEFPSDAASGVDPDTLATNKKGAA